MLVFIFSKSADLCPCWCTEDLYLVQQEIIMAQEGNRWHATHAISFKIEEKLCDKCVKAMFSAMVMDFRGLLSRM